MGIERTEWGQEQGLDGIEKTHIDARGKTVMAKQMLSINK